MAANRKDDRAESVSNSAEIDKRASSVSSALAEGVDMAPTSSVRRVSSSLSCAPIARTRAKPSMDMALYVSISQSLCMIRPTRRSLIVSDAKTANRMCPFGSIRKSPAITAASSRTSLTARLSGTNQSARHARIASASERSCTRNRIDVIRCPGASDNQSSGNGSKADGSKGRSCTPSENTVYVTNSVCCSHFSQCRPIWP